MSAYTFLEVGYCYFGLPLYDNSERSWAFGRNPGRYHALEFLAGFELLLDGCQNMRQSSADSSEYRLASTKYLKQVLDSRHDLYNSEHLIKPSLFTSQMISKAQKNYDPLQGDVLAVGLFRLNKETRTPLYALPGGESGESLRLVKTEFQKYSFQDLRSYLLVPKPTAIAWSVGRGASIRQIQFSSPQGGRDGNSKYLAVRYPTSTVIFHVNQRSISVPPTGYVQNSKFPFASIEARRFVEIPLRSSFSHSDIAFNPWYHRQVAVVDQSGSWLILDLKEERLVLRSQVLVASYSGTIMAKSDGGGETDTKSQEQPLGYQEDGWVRFRWIADVNTLILCTRTHVEFVDIKGRQLPARDLTTQEKDTWNLDIRVCNTNKDQYFILTTARILWCKISPADDPKMGGKVLLSIRHGRDPRDLTMQIKVLEDDDGPYNNTFAVRLC
jgi:RNA polymerase I-specific transcription initiation factor RRN6